MCSYCYVLLGGAIYIDFSNDLTWFDGGTFFTGNEAMSGSGGAVFLGCKVGERVGVVCASTTD